MITFPFIYHGRLSAPQPPLPQLLLVTPSDQIDANEAFSAGRKMALADNLEVRDVVFRALVKRLADMHDASDASSRLWSKSYVDQQDYVDIPVRMLAKRLGERQDLVDTVSGVLHRCIANVFATAIRNRLSADTLDVFDDLTTEVFVVELFTLLALSDSLDVSDGLNKLLGMGQGDAQPFSDAFNKLLAKSHIDQHDAADGLSKLLGKSISEIQEIVDIARAKLNRILALADDLHIQDAVTRALTKMLGDLGQLTDDRSSLLAKSIGDRQDVADVATTDLIRAVIMLMLADDLNLSDEHRKLLAKSVADSDIVRDVFGKILATVLGDRAAADDGFGKSLFQRITERQDLSDFVLTSFARQLILALADALVVSDEQSKMLTKASVDAAEILDGFGRLIASITGDSVAVEDQQGKTLTKRMLDSALISDAAATYLNRFFLAADRLEVGDDFRKALRKLVGDIGSVADQFASLQSRRIGDTQDVFDAVSINKITGLIILMLADSLALSDAQRKSLFKTVGEAFAAEEDLRKQFAAIIGDQQNATDAQAKALFKLLLDRQDFSDAAIISVIVGLVVLAISDSLALSDDQRKELFKNVGDIGSVLDAQAKTTFKSLLERQDASDVANRFRLIVRSLLDDVSATDIFARTLLKTLSDNEAILDVFAKIWTKQVGDSAELRDSLASSLSKAIGDNQTASDLLSKALAKTISDRQDFVDAAALTRLLRRLSTDSVDLSDTADATRITNQLIREVLETQDVADSVIRNLFKTLAEDVDASDALVLTLILAVPPLRQYIESMVASSGSPFGIEHGAKFGMNIAVDAGSGVSGETGSKAGIRLEADDDSMFDGEHGSKGRRLK